MAESEKTVLVTLRERPRREVQASAGFSYADGPRAQVQWTQGNLFGRNLTFSALGRVNFPFSRYEVTTCTPGTPSVCSEQFSIPGDPLERLIDLGLSVPRLDPITDLLRASIDLIHQRAVQYTYTLTKYSAQAAIALSHPVHHFGAGLAYEVGFQELGPGPVAQSLNDILAGTDRAIFEQPEGNMIFGSLRPNITVDFRDDPGIPRSGIWAQLSADYLRSLTANSIDVNLLQLQGTVAAYIPLPFRSSRSRLARTPRARLRRGRTRWCRAIAASTWEEQRPCAASIKTPCSRRIFAISCCSQVETCNHLISGLARTQTVAALQARRGLERRK